MQFVTDHMETATQAQAPGVHIAPNEETGCHTTLTDDVYGRLGWVALLYSMVYFTVHGVGMLLSSYSHLPGFSPGLAGAIAIICILSGIGVFALTRSRTLSPQAMLRVGLLFEVLAAAGIDVYFTWISVDGGKLIGLSWVSVWILCFGFVLPATPAQTLMSGIGAACMTPLMLSIGVARGVSEWDVRSMFMLIFPNFVCVGIAWASSRIIYRMRQEVREARALGSYKLVEQLGQGGMGEVWRAQHHRLCRPAAIKLIRPSMLDPKGPGAGMAFQRFEREAQVTATLESANTVRLYDYGISDDGTFYYVMEMLRGMDLQRLVARFGALPPARAVHLLRQACHSLDEAHCRGLIHRDVKPANIFACRMGQDYDFVKVLDFGLVKPVHSQDIALTQAGSTTGTPAYMAPELSLGTEKVDARSDIYSLGCVGYWLLTGRLVFEAPTALAMAMQHVQNTPAPPSEVSESGIPRELEQVILDCLEKDPGRRPQSMAVVAERLGRVRLDGWGPAEGRAWWLTHLPDLSAQRSSCTAVV